LLQVGIGPTELAADDDNDYNDDDDDADSKLHCDVEYILIFPLKRSSSDFQQSLFSPLQLATKSCMQLSFLPCMLHFNLLHLMTTASVV
jgi:hypothetical protein